ncbi:MAG: SusC/RagA family TonB-linked outer membrane protein, partial [Pseudarcicella sp.]|nr:SusC/RagA family TonB-linked outer membrane protein [Pseudarcicella sp.]
MLTNTLFIFAQERKINGRVTDAQGDPVPGVSVVQKGTTSGSTTNEAGEYNLLLKPASDVLIFSAVGFGKQEAKIGNRTEINVKLDIDQKSLDEVVVLGYGSKKKSLVTGSISSISAKDFEKQALTTVDQALQGRTPGLMISASSGSPGSASVLSLRGPGSNGKSDPVYIVDGMKTNTIDNISPSDIANIEVLKDAASTAIYGTDGGNGIIVITTKNGSGTKPAVTYSLQTGSQSLRTNMKLMNRNQYIDFYERAGHKDIAKMKANQTNTDWLKESFQDAPMQTHHLSFSGGGKMSSFLISGSLTNQDGILGGDKANFKRYTGRFNSKNTINDWLELGNNFSYSHAKRSAVTEDSEYRGITALAILADPLTRTVYNSSNEYESNMHNVTNGVKVINNNYPLSPNGLPYGVAQYTSGETQNPLAMLSIARGNSSEDRVLGNVYLNVKPIKGLTLTTRFGIDVVDSLAHSWTPDYYLSNEQNSGGRPVSDIIAKKMTWLWENFATYSGDYKNHSYSAVLGFTREESSLNRMLLGSAGFLADNPALAYHNYVATRAQDRVGGYKWDYNTNGRFLRLSYAFDNKYLFEASIRQDESSLFPEKFRTGTFPSASLGWIVSNENFMKNVSFFDYMKIRTSWGQNGSKANLTGGLGINYLTGQNIYIPTNDGTGSIGGLVFGPAINPELKWETSEQLDFGIEFRALKNSLNFSATYFNKTTKDLLLNGSIVTSPSAGITPPVVNAGEVLNKGMEFELGYNKKKNDFSYGINFNVTTLTNKVLNIGKYGNLDVNGATVRGRPVTVMSVDKPIWYFQGPKYLGANDTTGAPMYQMKKVGERNVIEQTEIGSAIPDLIFGAQFKLGYKAFDFNVNLQGTQGNDIMMQWFAAERISGIWNDWDSYIYFYLFYMFSCSKRKRKNFIPKRANIA